MYLSLTFFTETFEGLNIDKSVSLKKLLINQTLLIKLAMMMP